MLMEALCDGLSKLGREVVNFGVAATPTTGVLIKQLKSPAGGIQISASHNPAQYNGLKLFSCRRASDSGRSDVDNGSAEQARPGGDGGRGHGGGGRRARRGPRPPRRGPSWLCKPGMKPDPCAPGLSTTVYNAPLTTAIGVQHPKAQRNPPIDCFYVYPTVSDEKTANSDLVIQDTERSIALYQVARYSQYCRIYAPMYRQVTLAGAGLPGVELDATKPTRRWASATCENALADYLTHYNHGRGFVLIGHSQGSGVLRGGDRQEDRHQAGGPQAPAVGDPDGRQRAGEGQHRHRRRLQAHPGLPQRDPARLRDRVLHLRPAGAERQPVRSARGAEALGQPTPPKGDEVLCTNPANLAGGSGAARSDPAERAVRARARRSPSASAS